MRVHLDAALDNLQAYQLGMAVSGGHSGGLHLVDVRIDPRADGAFGGADPFSAVSVERGQMFAGVANPGGPSVVGAYLATFTYQACGAATGAYVVDAVVGPHANDSVLIARYRERIAIEGSTPAVITVAPPDRERPVEKARRQG